VKSLYSSKQFLVLSFTPLPKIYIFPSLEPSMPKKKVPRPILKNTEPKKEKEPSMNLEETLIRNLVSLQKVHTNLAEKFDKLTKEISQLLALFELTARNFAKHAPIGEYEKDKDFLEKIDKLLDQNKTLAKGLMLMEERLKERVYGEAPEPAHHQRQPPQPPQPPQRAQQVKPEDPFETSIASKRPLPRF